MGFLTLLLLPLTLASDANPEMTPWDKDLLNAAGESDLETVKSFLKSGASVNARSEYGETPLHVAAIKCDLEVVKVCRSPSSTT
jgi:ankyrin repeat protein